MRWTELLCLGIILFSAFLDSTARAEPSVYAACSPPLRLTRAEEDYTYLRRKECRTADPWSALKYVPLTKEGMVYATFGGEYRARYQLFRNEEWGEAPEDEYGFYSQRVSGHASLSLSPHFRIFSELYHGRQVGRRQRPSITQDDDLAVHQVFLEARIFAGNADLSLRLGRQELGLGSTRLVGIREGPNIRRSFDALRFMYRGRARLDVFFGAEVPARPGVFDNDSLATPKLLWAVYASFESLWLVGRLDLFYLGFMAEDVVYDSASGRELRHTLGVRSIGQWGAHFHYNTEVVLQLGAIDSKSILSYSFNADWRYEFLDSWGSGVGLNFDYIRGDHDAEDGGLETFNALFNNPTYLGLMAVIAPINLINLHPELSTNPVEGFTLAVDVDFYWRESPRDGVYQPPRFLARPTGSSDARYIGTEFGSRAELELNRHMNIEFELAYFLAGPFLAETGEDADILHLALTASFRL